MRSLDASIKSDFIRANSSDTTASSKDIPSRARSLKRTWSRGRSRSNTGDDQEGDENAEPDSESPTKRSRSRSRGFGFSKSDSPSKRSRSNSRPRSFTLHKSSSSTSLRSLKGEGSQDEKTKSASTSSSHFVHYLVASRQPQNVEIGKMQKLRQLLRNETVQWVDSFISNHGFTELLGLLTRITELEWRSVC